MLLDREGAVRRDLDADIALEQVVRPRLGGPRERQRREQPGGDRSEPARHAAQPAGAPGVKLTWGASRCASSSTSKNSRLEKPNGPAMKAPGTV